ncbi:hypothetical protein PIB30_078432, partial [Stylosanthes scabra]|nr:hypothetical protein [Stylosanthes scabra]
QFPQDVDDEYTPKAGMTFPTLEEATAFYKGKLSMQVHCIIENNDHSGIRPNQTYKSLVTAAGGHNELGFIEKDVRNYITREIRNVQKRKMRTSLETISSE